MLEPHTQGILLETELLRVLHEQLDPLGILSADSLFVLVFNCYNECIEQGYVEAILFVKVRRLKYVLWRFGQAASSGNG